MYFYVILFNECNLRTITRVIFWPYEGSRIRRFGRAARLLYPKYGRLLNRVNICSCACQSANIQQQESCAVAGVLGLKFANIIHWPKLTIFGLASVPVNYKELMSDSTGNCRCRQPHCLLMSPFSLCATLVNIRIKLIGPTVRMLACLPVIMWVSSFKNSWWTPKIQVFLKQLHKALQCHPKSLILAKIESAYYLLTINNNLGGILPHFRDSTGFLLKTALHSYSIRILGCSPCTRSKMLDPRDSKTLSYSFL